MCTRASIFTMRSGLLYSSSNVADVQAGLEHLDSTDLPTLAFQVAKTDVGAHCLPKTPFKGGDCSLVAGLQHPWLARTETWLQLPTPQEVERAERERRTGKHGAEEIAEWVRCLLYRGENLMSELQTHIYQNTVLPGTVLYVCSPCTCTASTSAVPALVQQDGGWRRGSLYALAGICSSKEEET